MKVFKIAKLVIIYLFIFIIIIELVGWLGKSIRSNKILVYGQRMEPVEYDSWSQYCPPIVGTQSGFRNTFYNSQFNYFCYVIWFFGGSTMRGYGADSLSIPSIVSRELKRCSNRKVFCVNWGVSAFTNEQEIRLNLNLIRKFSPPNLCIYYDGGNDITGILDNQSANYHYKIDKFAQVVNYKGLLPFIRSIYYGYQFSYTKYLYDVVSKYFNYHFQKEDLEEVIYDAAKIYKKNLSFISRVNRCFGTRTIFFLQPYLLEENKPEFDKNVFSKSSDYRFLVRKYYSDIRSICFGEENFVDLSKIFYDRDRDFYCDAIHLKDHAREIVAKKISRTIENYIEKK